jgi:hypothetical protein
LRISTVSPGLISLQVRSQRTVRHLDREEFELLVPGRAGDRIGAIDRLVADHQADHRELARTEAETGRTGHAEAEQAVGIMLDGKHRLGINAVRDLCRSLGRYEIIGLCWSVHAYRSLRLVVLRKSEIYHLVPHLKASACLCRGPSGKYVREIHLSAGRSRPQAVKVRRRQL